MEERYEKPEIEIILYDRTDVILTSGDRDEGDGFRVL